MILAVCVDNGGGMTFGNRRQSRDIVVCRDLIDVCKGNKLYIDEYSERIFTEVEDSVDVINVVTSLLDVDCGDNDCIFVENEQPSLFADKVSKIIVYKWNRDYPYDMQFDIDMTEWKLMSMTEFPGKSHERITREVYVRA